VKKGVSQVLNPGGTRSTFGYFIKARKEIETPQGTYVNKDVEFFVLFSYDTITRKGKDGKDEVICATELFFFTPGFRNTANGIGSDPYLEDSFAVDKNGNVLTEVPLDLARVSNFPGEGERVNEPVKPGLKPKVGCMVCHEKNSDSYPQSTTPFPWVKSPEVRPIDACVVGTWRSESAEADFGGGLHEVGGSGILLTVKEDGTETIDYSGMQPISGPNGELNVWSGTSTGKITTENGKAAIKSVEKSQLSHKFAYRGEERTNPLTGMGPASLGENKPDPSYTCDATTLKFKLLVQTFIFKRQGGATREKNPR
jgi:hypothetical protein